MKYVVDFEINGTIEVTAESEDEATDIVEAMNLHEIIEDADGVLIDACAQEVDEAAAQEAARACGFGECVS